MKGRGAEKRNERRDRGEDWLETEIHEALHHVDDSIALEPEFAPPISVGLWSSPSGRITRSVRPNAGECECDATLG